MTDHPYPAQEAKIIYAGPIDIAAAFRREAWGARREGFEAVAKRFDILADDVRNAAMAGEQVIIVLK